MVSDFRQSLGYQALMKQGGCVIADLGGGQVGYVARLRFLPFVSMLVIQSVEDPIALSLADEVSRRYRSLFIKIAPKAILSSNEASVWEKALSEHGYSWDRSGVAPTKTIIVDLGLPETDILSQMKPKTRYNVRLSERRGVTTRVVDGRTVSSNIQDCDEFYTVYSQNCQRIGMKSSRRVIENIITTFGENLFVVYAYVSGGELAAVASFIVTDDTVWYQMNGSTEKGRHDFATNLVVWEGMLEGKRRGCRWFDFDGVRDDRYKEDEDWKGFSRFKAGFGGREVTYLGSYIKRLPFIKK